MITAAVSLVIYVAAAFFPDGSTRYANFSTLEECQQAVSQARGQGIFATDCAKVELGQPSNGIKS